jgi:cation diffusion facilitator family transporter
LIPFLVLLRQESKGASAKAQLVELTSDVLGLVAAFAGTLIATKVNGYADPVASLVVAVIIALNAFGLARVNVSLLLGRSPGDEFKAKVLQAGQAVPGVLRVVDVAAEYVGQDVIHAGVRIQVERGTPIEKAEAIAGEVKERIHSEVGGEYCLVQVESPG